MVLRAFSPVFCAGDGSGSYFTPSGLTRSSASITETTVQRRRESILHARGEGQLLLSVLQLHLTIIQQSYLPPWLGTRGWYSYIEQYYRRKRRFDKKWTQFDVASRDVVYFVPLLASHLFYLVYVDFQPPMALLPEHGFHGGDPLERSV